MVLIVALQRGTEKRKREAEESLSSAQLSENRMAQGWETEGEASPEGRKKVVFVCVYIV